MLIRTRSRASSLRMPSLSNPKPNLPKSLPSESPCNSSFPILTNPKMFFPCKNSPQKLTFYTPFSAATSPTKLTASGDQNGVVLESTLVVVSFYKFADFPDHAHFRAPLKQLCQRLFLNKASLNLCVPPSRLMDLSRQQYIISKITNSNLRSRGTIESEENELSTENKAAQSLSGIILAPEGINGSICGTRESVEKVIGFIQSDERLMGLRQVESPVSPEDEAIHHGHTSSSPLAAGEDAPFRWDHVRVKLKKEIVSLGMPSVSPIEKVGKYISPKDWNALISDPDTVVIDVRNDYETRIGKFKGAVDPSTSAFREFPSWVDDQYQPDQTQNQIECNNSSANMRQTEGPKLPPRVAMYCTGGIRCEKASSLLLSKGFKEVYHLEGGILKYLEDIPKAKSLWEGECFVFDKRVSVDHGLVQGTFKLCYGCKQPVSDADMEAPEWEYGVSCPYCYSSKSEEEKARARARQRQFETWGVIGGPDKGRRPARTVYDNEKTESPNSNVKIGMAE